MISAFARTKIIVKRELASYFATPLAYIFMVIFLMLNGVFTFFIGRIYERGQADLLPFFNYHPWLYLFLVPAIAMRLWAEERKAGSIELLLTLPVRLREAVIGKFLAAWLFTGIALALTFPVWLTVNYLGDPDNGVILASYLGSWLMAGSFLAIGSCMSAVTSNQVIAFILSVVICFLFIVTGFPMVMDWVTGWAPLAVIDAVAALSIMSHFESISKGVLDLRDILYYLTMIGSWLLATAIVIDMKKAN
jgi:ABC-2 type transport system permease protein